MNHPIPLFWRRAGRIWVQGLLLFCLRLAQNRTGFDPDTGLAVPNVPGAVLLACLAVCAAAELLLCFRLPRGKAAFDSQFAPPEGGEVPLAAAGGILLAAGGALLLGVSLPGWGAAAIAGKIAGALGAASGLCFLQLTRKMRAGGTVSAALMLPPLFFGVFLVLSIYLPYENDPVLARFYIPVLASAFVAYAFSQLADFLRGEGRRRSFVPTADLAVLLCLTALADVGLALQLPFAGCALVLTLFLLLGREDARGAELIC